MSRETPASDCLLRRQPARRKEQRALEEARVYTRKFAEMNKGWRTGIEVGDGAN
jgi:hypothetical protein